MSAGLKRARRPYLVKNAVTGAILGAFAIGIWAYSIRAVKQDIFDDVDEEARVLAGTGATATMRSLEDDAKQSTKAKSEMVLGSGPTLVPPVTTKKETETEKCVVGRGVLVSLSWITDFQNCSTLNERPWCGEHHPWIISEH